MGLKTQLSMGVMSAALGLSLVGGGTWAAFNDTKTINNYFKAGTLNLAVDKLSGPVNFDLSNLKPRDSVERLFTLRNAGSLAIKEILVRTGYSNFVDFPQQGVKASTANDFLAQFGVEFWVGDTTLSSSQTDTKLNISTQTLTLLDVINNSYTNKIRADCIKDGQLNLAGLLYQNGSLKGIPANKQYNVLVKITFLDKTDRNSNGQYLQNEFQGDSINFALKLEATQWDGVVVTPADGNGAVNNGVNRAADGSAQPSPRVTGSPTIPDTGTVTD